jgi:hypothetical protein
MSYQSTSGAAYASLGTIAPHQSKVLQFLRSAGPQSDGYNNRQIAQILKWPINCVTPRVLELRELGLVVLAGKRKDTFTGLTVMHWKVP